MTTLGNISEEYPQQSAIRQNNAIRDYVSQELVKTEAENAAIREQFNARTSLIETSVKGSLVRNSA